MSDDPAEADGWIMTHITCPNCASVFEVEGDAQGDTVVCPDCETECSVRIGA